MIEQTIRCNLCTVEIGGPGTGFGVVFAVDATICLGRLDESKVHVCETCVKGLRERRVLLEGRHRRDEPHPTPETPED